MRAVWIVPIIASILILGALAPSISFEDAFAKEHKEPKPPKEKKSDPLFDIVSLLEQILAVLQNQVTTLGEVLVTNDDTNPVPVEIQGDIPVDVDLTTVESQLSDMSASLNRIEGLLANVPQSDADNDTVPDSIDNCPVDFNPNQTDSDGDGIGNLCDAFPFLTCPSGFIHISYLGEFVCWRIKNNFYCNCVIEVITPPTPPLSSEEIKCSKRKLSSADSNSSKSGNDWGKETSAKIVSSSSLKAT